jgi:endo-1,4-beta-xylanase
LADARGLQVGAGITGWWFTDAEHKAEYKALLGREFGLAVVHWGLYWGSVEPQRGQFDFSIADKQVAFAQSNDMNIRGHPLVFPTSSYGIADWVTDDSFSRDELTGVLCDHIAGILDHYRDQVDEWVVVNEPYLNPYRKKDVFHETIGPEYIQIAFQAARQAAPSATLIYNDTDNHLDSGLTTDLTRKNLAPLKSAGLVDAVGLHMHLDGAKPPRQDRLISCMRRYEMPVYVTELDVNLRDVKGTTEERYRIQAQIYREVVEACLESGVCRSIAFWDIGDKYAWREWPQESPHASPNADMTLYDDTLSPKPAYYSVREALAQN